MKAYKAYFNSCNFNNRFLILTPKKKLFQSDARIVLDIVKRGDDSDILTSEMTLALVNLWADKAVSKTALIRGNEYQLVESAAQ